MLRRPLTLALVLPALAPATAAAAPSVTVDKHCYYGTATRAAPDLTDRVHVTGDGFAHRAAVTVSAHGDTLAFADQSATTSGPDGHVDVTVSSPHISRGVRRVVLTVATGGRSATVPVHVTDFAAVVRPAARPGAPGLSPRRRVTIRLYGWGVGRRAYVHFVAPGATTAKRSVRLGVAGGRCGELKVHRRHFWPFVPHVAGAWRLQYDARRRYDPATVPEITQQSVITLD